MNTLAITVCPSCGSEEIKKVCRDWSGEFQGRPYTVPSLDFYECPACGEKVYNREPMRKIQEHSPAFDRAHSQRRGKPPPYRWCRNLGIRRVAACPTATVSLC